MVDRNPSRSGLRGGADWVGFGPFAFDRRGEQLRRGGLEVHLAPRAAAVLRELVECPGEIVSKDALLAGIWNGTPVTEDALTQAVSLMRQALGDDARRPLYVETVARRGYRFVESVAVLDQEPQLPRDAETTFAAGRGQWLGNGAARMLAAALLVAAAAVAGWMARGFNPTPSSAPVRFEIHPPAGVELPSEIYREGLAISSDGRYVAFFGDSGGERRIYLRDLRSLEVSPVGPDLDTGLRGGASLSFSPDGAWFGFWQGEGFWRLPRAGGSPTVLVEDAHPHGIAWLGDDSLLYRWNARLWHRRLGGEPRQMGEGNLLWPQVLPGERYALACLSRYGTETFYDANILVIDLVTGEQRELPFRGTAPRYAESGHLLFARDSALFAVPFDLESAEPRGVPVKVLDGIATSYANAVPSYAVSANGTLVYRPVAGPMLHQVVWLDVDGRIEVIAEGDPYSDSAASPDGRYLALSRGAAATSLHLYDIERRTMRRLVPPGDSFAPLWTPDSSSLIYLAVDADRVRRVMIVDPALPGSDRVLHEGPGQVRVADPATVWSVHPDGRRLAYAALMRGSTAYDVRILDIGTETEPGAEPYTLLGSKFDEERAAFSPDGNWLAYVSNETGRREVYLTDFPGAAQRLRVSTAGGTNPKWAPDMSVLYYQEASRIMRVPLNFTGSLRLGAPDLLVDGGLRDNFDTGFELSADGTRFIIATEGRPPPMHQINVVLNWFSELEQLVPTGR